MGFFVYFDQNHDNWNDAIKFEKLTKFYFWSTAIFFAFLREDYFNIHIIHYIINKIMIFYMLNFGLNLTICRFLSIFYRFFLISWLKILKNLIIFEGYFFSRRWLEINEFSKLLYYFSFSATLCNCIVKDLQSL